MPISESLDNTKVLRITFDVLHEVMSHKKMQLLLGFPLRTSTLTAKYGTRNATRDVLVIETRLILNSVTAGGV
jgi:hypothetical protein